MTEDEISRGPQPHQPLHQGALRSRRRARPRSSRSSPGSPPDRTASDELWKLNRYYDAVDDVDGVEWELHNLSRDPEERTNRAEVAADAEVRRHLEGLLAAQRLAKRRTPQRVNLR